MNKQSSVSSITSKQDVDSGTVKENEALKVAPAETKEKEKRKKVPVPGAPFNEVERTILERRSIRTYRKKQVPEHIVKRMLEAGRYGPTAGNDQSWKFIVIRDEDLLSELTQQIVNTAKKFSEFINPAYKYSKTPQFIYNFLTKMFTSKFHPVGIIGMGQVATGELGVFHGAPTVILLLHDKRGNGDPRLDLGIAGQNMCLAAHSMGLGTCWVSFANFLQFSKKHRKKLQIPDHYVISSSLAVGYTRGIGDGFVPRETHETLWFEDGKTETKI